MCKCKKLLQPYLDWEKTSSSAADYFLGFTLLTLNTSQVTTYCTGRLDLDATGKFLQGEGVQLFSDRLWGSSGGFDLPDNPFDPKFPDKLGVKIDVESGRATVTLLSKGKAQDTAELRCANGLLYGFWSQSGQGMMISLKKAKIDLPR